MDKEKVVIFGHGQVYARKRKYVFDNYEVIGIIDNSVEVGTSKIDEITGIKITNPECIKNNIGYKIIVLSYAVGNMVKQLLSLGIKEENIILGISFPELNIFEEMLFSDDGASCKIYNQKVYYINRRLGLNVETNPASLEDLIFTIKHTDLYRTSEPITESLTLRPIDDTYGMLRGKPIDRYYIEKFLNKQSAYIQGCVMEIGDRDYTLKYGKDKVRDSIVIHAVKEDTVNGIFKGDLVSGKGIKKESVDCFICTQTLPFIFDIKAAAFNIIESLKPGGVALVTTAGISQIIDYEKREFGHYWSFTEMSLRKLFLDIPDVKSVQTETYGNVKTSALFLYGVSSDELDEKELDYNDPNYQLIVTAVVHKVK